MLFILKTQSNIYFFVNVYVTNKDYSNKSQTENVQLTETKAGTKVIKKENLKIGVLYIGSAQETSGYTYAHDLGISQMINNIGLQNNQVIRKESINDGDKKAIDKALDECISEGCNVIIGTSWGYMDEMSTYSEKYPDIYFSHGTGYKSNGNRESSEGPQLNGTLRFQWGRIGSVVLPGR